MNSKLLNHSPATYVLVFETDDEVISRLTDFARAHQLAGSHFSAIGAFRDVVLGYFNWQKKDYKKITLHEQVEFCRCSATSRRATMARKSTPMSSSANRMARPTVATCSKRTSGRRWK